MGYLFLRMLELADGMRQVPAYFEIAELCGMEMSLFFTLPANYKCPPMQIMTLVTV